jgi:hypothetical protein
MIGTDVGEQGEREFQSQTTGRFFKDCGGYRAISQELELEFVPGNNFRIELGSTFALHDIVGVPGFADASQLAWQGASVDLRYKFLDRDAAPFGLTFAIETHADRIDETTAALARQYGNELTLAFDRELVPGFVMAGLNLLYQPEWTHFADSATAEQEATVGAAFSAMAQVRPGFFLGLGGEARYLRKVRGHRSGRVCRARGFRWADRPHQAPGSRTADRRLERSGLGTRSRELRNPRPC